MKRPLTSSKNKIFFFAVRNDAIIKMAEKCLFLVKSAIIRLWVIEFQQIFAFFPWEVKKAQLYFCTPTPHPPPGLNI